MEHTLVPDSPRRTYSQGSVQELPNRDFMVGWGGDEPWFSEFSGDGQLIYDAHLVPKSLDSYRVYRLLWQGYPDHPPSIAATASGGHTTVYASWNGATELASWRVLGGSGSGRLTPVASHARSGFETAIDVPSASTRFQLQALAADGRVIGTSDPFAVGQ